LAGQPRRKIPPLHGGNAKGRARRGGKPAWQSWQSLRKTGGRENAVARRRKKGNLRDKRSDPSSRANAPPKAGADPGTKRRWGDDLPTRQIRVRRDTTGRWFPNRAKRPHPIIPPGDRWDGPAARPQTPLAVENSVGELTANPHRLSAKCQYPGKRAWRAPTPNFAQNPAIARSRGFLFFEM